MDRVLLGAIFRKLPLKLLLVILACVAVFVACTKADFTCQPIYAGELIYQQGNNYTFNPLWQYFPDANSICIINDSQSATLQFRFNSIDEWNEVGFNQAKCFDNLKPTSVYLQCKEGTRLIDMGYIYYDNDCLGQHYTSQQCQSEYNLIPINEVDNAYCESNNLCSSSSSPTDCPNVGVSNLFINDIFHPGAFNVIMNIPEEIDWDYAYTNSGSNINIDVVGYNQDTEYINGLIDVQNYQPTTDDFTKVFTNFGYFGGLLVACLFVILVFYFIKRLFK